MRQAYLVTWTKERLSVARRRYAMRFPDEDVADLAMQQLRRREGAGDDALRGQVVGGAVVVPHAQESFR